MEFKSILTGVELFRKEMRPENTPPLQLWRAFPLNDEIIQNEDTEEEFREVKMNKICKIINNKIQFFKLLF